jgi:hypothetical protein
MDPWKSGKAATLPLCFVTAFDPSTQSRSTRETLRHSERSDESPREAHIANGDDWCCDTTSALTGSGFAGGFSWPSLQGEKRNGPSAAASE